MPKPLPYQPTWPETVIFWGAGATAALGLPTTARQSEFLHCLADDKDDELKIEERVKKALGEVSDERIYSHVADLLIILGEEEPQSDLYQKALQRQFGGDDSKIKDTAAELRRCYNWSALRSVIHICPGYGNANNFKLIDLYNLLDMHISTGRGFYVPPAKKTVTSSVADEKRFITVADLIAARQALKMLIILIFNIKYHHIRQKNNYVLKQYRDFARVLAKLMQQEGLDRYRCSQPADLTDRKFFLFSYAVISMNWDSLLLWMIFNAHREHNDSPAVPHISTPGTPAVPLKLFNDMGVFMAVREIVAEPTTLKAWYPYNETVVQRINDPEHMTSRRIRVGKFYFLHGSLNWRECPNCGKLTMHLGEQWRYDSETLFSPQLLDNLSLAQHTRRSEQEYEVCEKQRLFDSFQCIFCGTLTGLKDTAMIVQSNFKASHPPFIEEILRDVQVALEYAKHIVLMGYSLPEDDFIYRSLLSARQFRQSGKKPLCSVVGKDDTLPDKWLQHDDQQLTKYLGENPDKPLTKTVTAARDIFGKEQVRVYARGVPQVFLDPQSQQASEQRVKKLLYPKQE